MTCSFDNFSEFIAHLGLPVVGGFSSEAVTWEPYSLSAYSRFSFVYDCLYWVMPIYRLLDPYPLSVRVSIVSIAGSYYWVYPLQTYVPYQDLSFVLLENHLSSFLSSPYELFDHLHTHLVYALCLSDGMISVSSRSLFYLSPGSSSFIFVDYSSLLESTFSSVFYVYRDLISLLSFSDLPPYLYFSDAELFYTFLSQFDLPFYLSANGLGVTVVSLVELPFLKSSYQRLSCSLSSRLVRSYRLGLLNALDRLVFKDEYEKIRFEVMKVCGLIEE